MAFCGLTRDEVLGSWRKLHSEELLSLSFHPVMIKARKLIDGTHSTSWSGNRNSLKELVDSLRCIVKDNRTYFSAMGW